MRKPVRVVIAGLLLVGGGAVAVPQLQQWRQDRLARCEERGTRLQGLPLLREWPQAPRPSEFSAGCDIDRVVAYGGRQFQSALEPGEVVAFYRGMVERAGWQVVTQVPPPRDDTALLCASADVDGDKTYLNLTVVDQGIYDVTIADSHFSGAQCA
ncbi:hypothetical protein [Couchioplanes azureus]|uniref:hypothetical protein n=1 Tax=Couchioplanes caeruleus TaxID=56438 RepID=UPI00166FE803|nr:hypothetical protein [Couchioplanes caeruleus]GGQ73311.1 hypothetical protein GCM10010166_49180 [Couchioplanes caeruleus subsp. azureus]